MNRALSEALEQLVTWVRLDMLPLWRQKGVQVSEGWAYSCLDTNGNPDQQSAISIAAQAQVAYVFARAEQLGWLIGSRSLVRNLLNFAGRHGTLPCRSDGYVRSLDRQFSIIDERHDLTDHAFFMLSSAAAHTVYGDDSDIRRAYNIYDWIELRLSHPSGGWFENTERPPQRTSRSHLQMLLAFLYVYEVTQKPVWLDRATAILRLYEQKFFDPVERRVISDFNADWGALPDAGVWSPEQQFLWVYGISKFARCSGRRVGAEDLYHSVCSSEVVTPEGMVLAQGSNVSPKNRLERSTPALAAGILAGVSLAALGDTAAAANLQSHIEALFRECVSRDKRIFVDTIDADGNAGDCGSAATMLLLFEAARDAAKVLRAGVQPAR